MKIKKIIYSGLLIAVGIILPQVFHIFGQLAGKTFLPMHIGIMLAGFLVGPIYGMGVAIIVPCLSSLLTGMPPVPLVYFMLFELVTYAFVIGVLYNKFKLNMYICLIAAMICGRLAYGLSLVVAVNIFSLNLPFANVTAFFAGITTGLPGIVMQLVLIPPIIFAIQKGGQALAKRKAN